MKRFCLALTSITFAPVCVFSQTSSSKDETILVCQELVDHGYSLDLFKDADGEARARLFLTDFFEIKVVSELSVCQKRDTPSDLPGNVLGCNNTEWHDRWNVKFTAGLGTSGDSTIVGILSHNEKELASLRCSVPQRYLAVHNDKATRVFEALQAAGASLKSNELTLDVRDLRCSHSPRIVWSSCEFTDSNDSHRSKSTVFDLAHRVLEALNEAGIPLLRSEDRMSFSVNAAAINCVRGETDSCGIVY